MKNHIKKNKLIITVLCVILVLVLMYLFVLPSYVIDRIERAHFVDVWYGEICYQTEDAEDISALLDGIGISKWKRTWTTDMQHLGLPDVYITVDQRFNVDLWVGEEECYIKVYFHSSNIEIASYYANVSHFSVLP
ncbi:MAG: hypothetical protein GX236_10925 [Clostridiaceae bacterium]|nr:hypothetical protein [Clostridiaceae bacterium]